jgi:hypothetical protein
MERLSKASILLLFLSKMERLSILRLHEKQPPYTIAAFTRAMLCFAHHLVTSNRIEIAVFFF